MTTILQIEQMTRSDLKAMISNVVKAQLEKKAEKPISYSKKDFAKAIGKSVSFVDQERRAGRLNWSRNGGTVSIPASELSKYIIIED